MGHYTLHSTVMPCKLAMHAAEGFRLICFRGKKTKNLTADSWMFGGGSFRVVRAANRPPKGFEKKQQA